MSAQPKTQPKTIELKKAFDLSADGLASLYAEGGSIKPVSASDMFLYSEQVAVLLGNGGKIAIDIAGFNFNVRLPGSGDFGIDAVTFDRGPASLNAQKLKNKFRATVDGHTFVFEKQASLPAKNTRLVSQDLDRLLNQEKKGEVALHQASRRR